MSLSQVGIVRHGPWHLALPIKELIEVIPCQALEGWPSANKAIRGCIDIRGNVIPVIDLLQYYHQQPAKLNSVAVVQMHAGVFAFVTEAVEGIVALEELHVTSTAQELALPGNIIKGGFYREDCKQTVLLLDAEAVVLSLHIPVVSFQRQVDVHQNRPLRSMMLARCGQLFFALDAISVYSTVLNPEIVPMDVQNDYLIGAILFQQVKIPAVDFLAWCRLNSRVKHRTNQAFVIQLDTGFVALLVEEIIDVVEMAATETASLPPMSLPFQDKFKGLFCNKQFGFSASTNEQMTDYFIEVDAEKLLVDQELSAIAKATAQQQNNTQASYSGEDLVIFEAGSELSVPLVQIVEILPWQSHQFWQQDAESSCGLMLYRDSAISVFDLIRLFKLDAEQDSARTMIILVVEEQGHRYGFAVEKLTGIEKAKTAIQFGIDESSAQNIRTAVVKISRPKQPMVTCIDFSSICSQLIQGIVPSLALIKQSD